MNDSRLKKGFVLFSFFPDMIVNLGQIIGNLIFYTEMHRLARQSEFRCKAGTIAEYSN